MSAGTNGRRSAVFRAAGIALVLLVVATFSLVRSASGQSLLSTIQDQQSQVDCALETPDHFCIIGEGRANAANNVDSLADPVASPVSAAAEGGVTPRVCATDVTRSRSNTEAIACAGGSGNERGRTYYKGDGAPDYHCEFQDNWVPSTNHRYPKAVYNSMRVCRPGMRAWIACGEKGERVGADRACTWPSSEWRNSGELMSMSFSARYRKFYCTNDGTAGYVRCAYDWVS